MTDQAIFEQRLAGLEQRLQILEAIDRIKTLKARYFMACDSKKPELMRQCFVDGEVHIDYGPVGQFSHRDQLVSLFSEVGCHPHMLEMHHGHNPVIQLDPEQTGLATGSWELCYQLINTRDKTLTQLGLIYQDEYREIDGQWLISKTVTQPQSTLLLDISSDTPTLITVA